MASCFDLRAISYEHQTCARARRRGPGWSRGQTFPDPQEACAR
jgi:hypothetical protein